MTFWRDDPERPGDDVISRTSGFVFALSLCHLRAVVLRLQSLRGPEAWLVCVSMLCVPVFYRKQEMRPSVGAEGGGVVRKVQETLGSLEQLPLWVEWEISRS